MQQSTPDLIRWHYAALSLWGLVWSHYFGCILHWSSFSLVTTVIASNWHLLYNILFYLSFFNNEINYSEIISKFTCTYQTLPVHMYGYTIGWLTLCSLQTHTNCDSGNDLICPYLRRLGNAHFHLLTKILFWKYLRFTFLGKVFQFEPFDLYVDDKRSPSN